MSSVLVETWLKKMKNTVRTQGTRTSTQGTRDGHGIQRRREEVATIIVMESPPRHSSPRLECGWKKGLEGSPLKCNQRSRITHPNAV